MVATGYVDCNAPLAVFLITTAIAFAGISFAGWAVNHLDLAPPYAGQNHNIHITVKNVCKIVAEQEQCTTWH